MPRGNVGDWSELYTLIKLLADGKIYAADVNLNRNDSLFYLVLKILRNNSDNVIYFKRNGHITIEDINNSQLRTLSYSRLNELARNLLDNILNSPRGEGNFEIDNWSEISDELLIDRISDNRVDKSDIKIYIHDPITQYQPLLGFSIKSYIGSKPTLFNASKSTNIIYKLDTTLSDRRVLEINRLRNYGSILRYLKDHNLNFRFYAISNEIFRANLEQVDSRLPEILAEMVKYKFLERRSNITDILAAITSSNPCNYALNINPNFYIYKFKRLLVDVALGMKARTPWEGTFDATGGYIAVKQDGDLVCFHIFNWNDFQEYLIQNTKFDAPDSSPNRCDYGKLYNEEHYNQSGTFIKLNFQIRFK